MSEQTTEPKAPAPKKAEKKPEPKAEPKPLTIWQAIPAITGDVSPISKNKDSPQGFKFRGIDDVYAALNLLLAKHGVSILPELLDSRHEQCGTTKSGSAMWRHTVKVRYHLIASDGSRLTADFEGEGMDTGDKATPKAYSTAYKIMAFEVFCIPTGEKVDSEEDSPEVVDPKIAAAEADKKASEQIGLYGHYWDAIDAVVAADVQKLAAEIKAAFEEGKLAPSMRKPLLEHFAARKKALAPPPAAAQSPVTPKPPEAASA